MVMLYKVVEYVDTHDGTVFITGIQTIEEYTQVKYHFFILTS